MRTIILSIITIGLLNSGITVMYAANSLAEKEASPTSKERLTKGTIKGTLLAIAGKYYCIAEEDGIGIKLHVDKSTKLDPVKPGDTIKAYVTEEGHTANRIWILSRYGTYIL
ncbi:MAG: hypothetical protein H8K03_20365 [Nitrospira sp.]